MKKRFTFILVVMIMLLSNVTLANEKTTVEFFEDAGAAYLVVGDNVRVRTHPTLNGYIIRTLSKGEWVKSFNYQTKGVLDTQGIYWKYIIMSDGNVGWVAARYLSLRC